MKSGADPLTMVVWRASLSPNSPPAIIGPGQYRDNKNRTMLEMLPDVLGGTRARTWPPVPATTRWNTCRRCWSTTTPYDSGRNLDLGRRARPEQGHLVRDRRENGQHRPAIGLLR